MVSNVHSLTFLLRWSKIIRHSDSIALDAGLCMDINQCQFILSTAIWSILLYFVLLQKLKICLKNLRSVFVMLYSLWKHFEKGNLNSLWSYVFK